MRSRYASLTILLGWSIFLPSVASACRVPLRPAALRAYKADAIVLVKVTDSQSSSKYDWTAAGAIKGVLFGSYPAGKKVAFGNQGIIISCHSMGQPQPDRYYILYFERTDQGFRYAAGSPFWFARASEDPRLAKLNKFMPLGTAREPTADEKPLIDLAEPRVSPKTGISDLSGYTRIYGRSSASSVSVLLFRSRTPRRLIVDDPAEFPTAESCRCRLVEASINMDDLWAEGKLPPFNP